MLRVGADDLMDAAQGHVELCDVVGMSPMQRLLEQNGVDAAEFHGVMVALKDTRRVGDHPFTLDAVYAAGILDGAILMKRACDIAHDRLVQDE